MRQPDEEDSESTAEPARTANRLSLSRPRVGKDGMKEPTSILHDALPQGCIGCTRVALRHPESAGRFGLIIFCLARKLPRDARQETERRRGRKGRFYA